MAQLARRFPNVQEDLKAAKRLVEAGTPLLQTNRLQGYGDRNVSKSRIVNSDINQGKSAGYRLVWEQQATTIVFLFVYPKQDAPSSISENEWIRSVVFPRLD